MAIASGLILGPKIEALRFDSTGLKSAPGVIAWMGYFHTLHNIDKCGIIGKKWRKGKCRR